VFSQIIINLINKKTPNCSVTEKENKVKFSGQKAIHLTG